MAGSFAHNNEPLGPVKGGKFLEQLKEFCKNGYTYFYGKEIHEDFSKYNRVPIPEGG